MNRLTIVGTILLLLFTSCTQQKKKITSPNGGLELSFGLTKKGQPYYHTQKGKTVVLDKSTLGFEFKGQEPLRDNLSIIGTEISDYNKTWQTVWGEQKNVRNNYQQMLVHLQEKEGLKRKWDIYFRVYDDGIAIRHYFPKQDNLNQVNIMNEQTTFSLTSDNKCWWIPAGYDSYEYLYTTSLMSEIDTTFYTARNEKQIANPHAVNTPFTMKTKDGLFLSFHEANLTNYAGMTLAVKPNHTLESELVPWQDGVKVKIQTPFYSPWRTVLITDDAAGLYDSRMIINLNEPNKIKNTDWIKTAKYAGIWWGMHIGETSWDLVSPPKSDDPNSPTTILEISPKIPHGATTKRAMEYIDFCAENNIQGLLIEGWNVGWEDWWNPKNVNFFDFMKPYADFDVEKVIAYANKKGVAYIMHNETANDITNYDNQMEKAFAWYKKMGVHYIKSGHVGLNRNNGEHHHGQWMVNFYRKTLEMAAKYQINIDAHEPIKATGIRRTYPNMMTREGVRGMEYNAWGGGNPPDHTCILPFTRGLAGPTDYTPGIFDIKFDKYRKDQWVRSTVAKQLALYVVLYSPLQMAADLPVNYKGKPPFQFIRDVATDWDTTVTIGAEIGKYVTVARKERNGKRWFVGAITNQEKREMELKLDFLTPNKTYIATIYADGKDAHYFDNPTSVQIRKKEVMRDDNLNLKLAEGGGVAIVFKPLNN